MPEARLLLVFVDGLGLAPTGPGNPVSPETCPSICRLLSESRPVDATLGMAGLPQSATGQTSLLTGVNAPRHIGRHMEGFPNADLRAIIAEHGLFRRCREAGIPAIFANGYMVESVEAAQAMRFKSATTVAALSGLGHIQPRAELEAGRAVAHDIIRDTLGPRGYTGSLITPAQAAADLAALAARHRFTLFEFFLTDRAGHRCDPTQAATILDRLDAMLAALLPLAQAADVTVALTSDHGNIEDLTVPTHTRNPVPWSVTGPGAGRLRDSVDDLTGIVPAVLEALMT